MRRPLPTTTLPALLLALAAGCEGEPRVLSPDQNQAAAPAPEPEQVQLRPVIGETTTAIRDAATELEQGGARVASGKITAKDPITLQGNAYVTIVGRASQLQIKHAVDLYHALHNKYPADLDEFMDEIIKPNGIALAQLPFYQEYGYDAANHRLVVLEYPDRKTQFKKQRDEEYGRN